MDIRKAGEVKQAKGETMKLSLPFGCPNCGWVVWSWVAFPDCPKCGTDTVYIGLWGAITDSMKGGDSRT